MTQEVNQVVSFVFDTPIALAASSGYQIGDLYKIAYVKSTGQLYLLDDPLTGHFQLINVAGTVTGAGTVLSPEDFGSVGADATLAFQASLEYNSEVVCITLVPGKTYNISDSLIFKAKVTIINYNGAVVAPQFGTNYGKALFSNRKDADISTSVIMRAPVIRGACAAVDLRYTANNPGAGLSLTLDNLDFNTNNGNRPAGSIALNLSHMDFLDVTKTKIYNTDQVAVLGAASPARNSTQLTLRNLMAGQTNGGVLFRGCDKVNIIGADIANCNNGFSFEGNNRQIYLNQCHVEGLGRATGAAGPAYSTKSSYVHATSEGVGYNFVDDQDNRNIKLSQCSIINLQTSGGTAKHGVRLGVSNYPGIVDVEFDGCTIPEACEGSTSYVPFRGYAPFSWKGKWTFGATSEMSANGLGYLDHAVSDSDNNYAPRKNLLFGTTPISLRTLEGTTAPTITEVAQSFNPMYLSHRIVFNSVSFIYNLVNLPVGWCTMDVVGQRIAGNVMLRVQQNGAPFTSVVNVQYKSLNDTFHRTRIVFYNPTPNQSYRVGLASQNASGDESVFSYIACYAGLPDTDIKEEQVHVVSTLPTASARWRFTEMVLVAAGTIDRHYRCVLEADGVTYSWKQITLT